MCELTSYSSSTYASPRPPTPFTESSHDSAKVISAASPVTSSSVSHDASLSSQTRHEKKITGVSGYILIPLIKHLYLCSNQAISREPPSKKPRPDVKDSKKSGTISSSKSPETNKSSVEHKKGKEKDKSVERKEQANKISKSKTSSQARPRTSLTPV